MRYFSFCTWFLSLSILLRSQGKCSGSSHNVCSYDPAPDMTQILFSVPVGLSRKFCSLKHSPISLRTLYFTLFNTRLQKLWTILFSFCLISSLLGVWVDGLVTVYIQLNLTDLARSEFLMKLKLMVGILLNDENERMDVSDLRDQCGVWSL